MKKTLITGLFLYPGKVGGAETYFYNLLDGFVQNGAQDAMQLLMNEAYQADFQPIIKSFKTHFRPVKYNRAVYDYIFPRLVKEKFEVYFSPNYITPLPLVNSKAQYVTTIHDLQYLNFPQFFSRLKRNWQYAAHLNTLNNCKSVICISEFVKNDIIKFFGKKYAPKLKVIHNPIDFSYLEKPAQSEKFNFDFPYILSVAAHYPHKNTLTLIKAFQIFNKKFPEVKLVLAGQLSKNLKGGNYEEYGQQLNAEFQKNPNILTTGFVSNEELAQLYQNCAFFVFPSLFEGFGMPPVEAMGLGKPTIVSKTTSLPEVTLNQAIYLEDPKNENELQEKINHCWQNLSTYTANSQALSAKIKQQFHPKNIAELYLQAINS
jgi:glycosyltransferase involved in cell wall biosynthesis